MIRLACLAVLCALAGCSIPLEGAPASGPQPSPGAVAACNSRADQAFLAQNRAALYRADRYQTSLKDAPASSSGLAESSAGLSDQFARDQDVRTCLNGVSGPVSGETAPQGPTPPQGGAQ